MLLRLQLSLLLLWMAGCASERLLVPEKDWQTVPTAQRASVDRRHAADLAAAHAELTAANAELAAFRRVHPGAGAGAGPAAPPRAIGAPRPSGDVWDDAVRDHEQARRAAFARVEADKATWLRTDLAWRELHVATASARVEVVVCEREMIRARTIDRSLLGTDSYDSAPVRGQFSRAQQRWYALSNQANQARDAFERASASLASAKEEYAQLMRNGPPQLRSQPSFADERPTRLELTAWAVQRSDIRRRRGLRHYLDEASNAPAGLRKAKIQLAARAVVLPRAPADVAATDPPAAPPSPKPPAVATKPAPPTPPAVATKPAPTPPPAVATKPAPPTPPAVATKSAPPTPPAVATKPAPQAPAAVATTKPTPTTPAVATKPAPQAPAAVATSKPAPTTPAAVATSKAAPTPAAVAAKPSPPVPAAAPKTATAAPLAPPASKPVAPKPAPAAPMFPSPASQSTPTSAAKSVEQSDTASR